MENINIVTQEEYDSNRAELLEREKALMKEKDAVSQLRRNLGVTVVDKEYTFTDEEGGSVNLTSLFSGERPVLIIQHFMFDDSWERFGKDYR